MRLLWPGVCWQPMLLAQLDTVSWGALVSDTGRSLCLPVALQCLSVPLEESGRGVFVKLLLWQVGSWTGVVAGS